MKQHCPKCTMSFRVEEPLSTASDVSLCPDCGLRFWHAVQKPNGSPVIVGIFPEDAKL